jgi:hypothetical protein
VTTDLGDDLDFPEERAETDSYPGDRIHDRRRR